MRLNVLNDHRSYYGRYDRDHRLHPKEEKEQKNDVDEFIQNMEYCAIAQRKIEN